MDLDAGGIDEQSIGGFLRARQRTEYLFPDTALRPAHEVVVECLLRAVHLARTIGPAPAILQCMDDPAQHPPVIHPFLAPAIPRQKRLNPGPLPIRKPKEIRHRHYLLEGDNESRKNYLGNPINGSGP